MPRNLNKMRGVHTIADCGKNFQWRLHTLARRVTAAVAYCREGWLCFEARMRVGGKLGNVELSSLATELELEASLAMLRKMHRSAVAQKKPPVTCSKRENCCKSAGDIGRRVLGDLGNAFMEILYYERVTDLRVPYSGLCIVVRLRTLASVTA